MQPSNSLSEPQAQNGSVISGTPILGAIGRRTTDGGSVISGPQRTGIEAGNSIVSGTPIRGQNGSVRGNGSPRTDHSAPKHTTILRPDGQPASAATQLHFADDSGIGAETSTVNRSSHRPQNDRESIMDRIIATAPSTANNVSQYFTPTREFTHSFRDEELPSGNYYTAPRAPPPTPYYPSLTDPGTPIGTVVQTPFGPMYVPSQPTTIPKAMSTERQLPPQRQQTTDTVSATGTCRPSSSGRRARSPSTQRRSKSAISDDEEQFYDAPRTLSPPATRQRSRTPSPAHADDSRRSRTPAPANHRRACTPVPADLHRSRTPSPSSSCRHTTQTQSPKETKRSSHKHEDDTQSKLVLCGKPKVGSVSVFRKPNRTEGKIAKPSCRFSAVFRNSRGFV